MHLVHPMRNYYVCMCVRVCERGSIYVCGSSKILL